MTDDLARKVARAEFWKRLALIGALILAASIIVFQVITVGLIRGTQQSGSPLVRQIAAQGDQIKSCTTPGGKCYERSLKSQASAIVQINEITIYAQACSNKMPGANVIQLQGCVRALYLDAHKQ